MSTIEEPEYDIADPRADSMIQSLRAVGYDLPTAVADLIDNSITAGAKNVWIDFHWSGSNSHVAISDDGDGMSEVDLINAMRIGSRNPLEIRDPKDLGRFGLGLKTASFSQCRKLTAFTKGESGNTSIRCWDLDYVTACGEWRLLKIAPNDFPPTYVARIGNLRSGTCVLWEKVDRITASMNPDGADDHAHFLSQIDQVKNHIAMVFHRFLESPRHLRIKVNDNLVKPWDPFVTDEIATQLLADEAIALFGDSLNVRPYVLPHHSKTSPEVYSGAAGPRGWYSQQGFYVYRNKRLLVAGDWLGLGLHKAEHYKLARIMLDIPNSMDSEWEIDVKKSRACPPPAIRKDLKRLALITRNAAGNIYRHRGSRISSDQAETVYLWLNKVRHGRYFYQINREHPLVTSVISRADKDDLQRIRALLSVIEESVPVPSIVMDATDASEKHPKPFEQATDALQTALRLTYSALLEAGFDPHQAKVRLLNTEPFRSFPEAIMALDDNTP